MGAVAVDPRVPPRSDPHRVHAARAASARGDRRRLHALALVDAVGTQRLPLPRRVPARVVGRRHRDRLGHPARPRAARPRAVVVSAALDRHDLVRALPLALARLPHHHGTRAPASRATRSCSPGSASRSRSRASPTTWSNGRFAAAPSTFPKPAFTAPGAGGGAPRRARAGDEWRGRRRRRPRPRGRSPRDRRRAKSSAPKSATSAIRRSRAESAPAPGRPPAEAPPPHRASVLMLGDSVAISLGEGLDAVTAGEPQPGVRQPRHARLRNAAPGRDRHWASSSTSSPVCATTGTSAGSPRSTSSIPTS